MGILTGPWFRTRLKVSGVKVFGFKALGLWAYRLFGVRVWGMICIILMLWDYWGGWISEKSNNASLTSDCSIRSC